MSSPQAVFDTLYAAYGPQHWWPATTDYEIIAGAVLTQNTAWRNVERALANLRARDLLAPAAVMAVSEAELADALRPAGYYNVKAGRLRNLTAALIEDGGVSGWRQWSTASLRRRLLGVRGVGAETADCILLYVLDRPVFVVDAYTRRILARLNLARGDESYDVLAHWFLQGLPAQPDVYNEYHALLVRLGSGACRPRPRCPVCPLADLCPTGRCHGGGVVVAERQ
ncbi:endonuclease [Aquisalimonas sp.]|uniref:endonuclease III domain-containing protein n=1 Tax=unclassified Aquisalimonas TaxID=2644645 RepID=UPI0025C3DE1F|nr:endonuclease [Aquisalimonas sp.]